MLEIKLNQYVGKEKLYSKTNLKINQGITILIGPNGSGKTYACHQIKDKYSNAYFIDIVEETKINYIDFKEGKSLGRWITASERTKSL